ncbi:MAG: hypothetical protein ACK55I_06775, partial [bacterium]
MGGRLMCWRRHRRSLSLPPLRSLGGFRLRDFLPQKTRAVAVALKLHQRRVEPAVEVAHIPSSRFVARLAAVRVVDPRQPSGRLEGPQDRHDVVGLLGPFDNAHDLALEPKFPRGLIPVRHRCRPLLAYCSGPWFRAQGVEQRLTSRIVD